MELTVKVKTVSKLCGISELTVRDMVDKGFFEGYVRENSRRKTYYIFRKSFLEKTGIKEEELKEFEENEEKIKRA